MTADEAIAHFNEKRTTDGKGLTIASQRRYVHAFKYFLDRHVNKLYFKNSLINYRIIENLLNENREQTLTLNNVRIGPFQKDL